jgi:uncharacterized protein (TIGR02118 family)
MYKLVILIEPPVELDAFEEHWPDFLHLSEAMPGLKREATSRVDHFLYGSPPYAQMHELFFDSPAAAQQALASPVGQMAGRLLQQISGGRMLLFFADHKEDDLANIRRYRQEGDAAEA